MKLLNESGQDDWAFEFKPIYDYAFFTPTETASPESSLVPTPTETASPESPLVPTPTETASPESSLVPTPTETTESLRTPSKTASYSPVIVGDPAGPLMDRSYTPTATSNTQNYIM